MGVGLELNFNPTNPR